MQITLIQGILISLVVFLCACDKHMEVFMWFRPLTVSFLTGLCLGNVQIGLQAGAVTELAYLGLLTVGGTVPPDPLLAGLMTTVLSYTTGNDVATSMGMAVTFALVGQWIGMATNTLYAGFIPTFEKAADNHDGKTMGTWVIGGIVIYAAAYAIVAFLCTYAFQNGIVAFVNSFPEWLVNGFNIAGGLMPAVGLALLLVVMLKADNFAYLILGFVLVNITNCDNILPIALIAAVLAFISYQRDVQISKLTALKGSEGDEEDGI
ncbi:MAG: PTS sugar transporter subunit IIC [Erysipelotrichaceae bacterium]|nr:PTS sugar transporter subunit IIC [Erysipelotrichaceae bacterium]